MRLVADVTDSTVQEIVALNPSLLRLSTPRDISFDLHLPVGMTDLFTKRVKNIPEDKRAFWRFHEVKAGESLSGIAETLHAKAAEIAEVNGLKAGDTVAAGDELVIPIAASAVSSGQPERYTVRKGDTLVTVADRFGVSVKQLRAWNHLSSSVVAKGRSLYVAEPVHLAPTALGRRMARTRKSTHSTSRAKKKAPAGKSSAKASATKARSKSSSSKKKSAP
jgi:membrane-bound lytic murein transglycosylase D